MDLAAYRNIVVLTGAGISRAAGLPTYRGEGGLWANPELVALTAAEALATRRDEVAGMFWSFRRKLAGVEPTAAHRALAGWQERCTPGTHLRVITQNIDGLHQRAGSRDVVDYHGSLARWRCECGHAELPADADTPPRHCGRTMRPDVVLFGEAIPVAAEHAAKRALRDCDLFIAIGTSGTVTPAASFVRWAALNGAHRVLVNVEVSADARELFGDVRQGPADELVPRLFG